MDIPSFPASAPDLADECSTRDVAQMLGMAVRSVQLMVDRGELQAWKTPGGHRRISRRSVEAWLAQRQGSPRPQGVRGPGRAKAGLGAGGWAGSARPCVLLIEDSRHFQNLVSLLVRQHFPEVELHLADDGITGLAMAGRLQPRVLLVDILLPGIDGATLINGLRSSPAFEGSRLIVVTSLSGDELQPYAFALEGLPVIHKPRLALELPGLLGAALGLAVEAADVA